MTLTLTFKYREDWDSENLRRDAYEAVNMIVTNSAKDMQPVVVHVLSEALNRYVYTIWHGMMWCGVEIGVDKGQERRDAN